MTPEPFSLANKVALITGATGGIARIVAVEMAQAGADVIVAGRRSSILDEVTQEVTATGQRCIPVTLDVTRADSITSAVETAKEEFGRIDILVNAAGVNGGSIAEEISEEEWDTQMNINVKGLFFLTQAIGTIMIAHQKGKIINFSSALARLGRTSRLVYCTSKAAVNTMSEVLALEWAKYNINVNVVAPTVTETPMTAALIADKELFDAFVRRVPLRRIAQPSDVAAACIYLASDASNFVTGQTIYVDGGWTIHQEPA